MISFKEFLSEMATPSEKHKGMVFYHGTSDEEAAQEILKSGYLKGRKQQDNGFLAPMKDHVYITPSLAFAQIHAIGGDMAGHDWNRIKGEHGYIFAVSGKHLKDIHPDEDSVGEKINKFPWLQTKADAFLTKRTRKYVNKGDMWWQSVAGKRLMPVLNDWEKHQIINDEGSHIAHKGWIKISKAWRIHKSKIKYLKRDGSNFFKHAERIK